MGLGDNNVMVAAYTRHQVVHVDLSPIVVTLIANSNTNTGHVIDIGRSLKNIVNDIARVLEE